MSTLNPSRREVIAALSITTVGTGAVLAAASNAMASPKMTPALKLAVRETEEAWRACENHPYHAAHPTAPDYDALCEDEAKYGSAVMAKFEAMMRTPARNVADLLGKLDCFLHVMDGFPMEVGHINLVRADVARIGGEA